MVWAMKVCRKPYIGCVLFFTSRVTEAVYRTMCVPAPPASRIRLINFDQLVYFSRSRYLLQFGLTLIWISLKGSLGVHGKTVILTVVDRFSKFAHFIPLSHPYTATTVAKAFSAEIVRLHGIPASIVSDWDPVFTSAFWKELFKLSGVSLNMSTAFHPRSMGSPRRLTRSLQCTFGASRVTVRDDGLQWLPWAEFCYNSSFQASLGTSPFE
ncbi:hypothetical protein U9M48_043642 [Paspalum notatum var. saurae]|uniref:Integrase catalytic domain-containing protein n=1 Tax=Paspalum notatum var. saurae TaxID=547442 RepID=A0AAQ3XGP8_PASNO